MEVRSDMCNIDLHVTKSTLDALDALDLSPNKADTINPYWNMKKFLAGDFNLGDI